MRLILLRHVIASPPSLDKLGNRGGLAMTNTHFFLKKGLLIQTPVSLSH